MTHWNEGPFAHLRPTSTPETMDRALYTAMRYAPLVFAASFIAASDYLVGVALNHYPELNTSSPAVAAGILLLMLLGDFSVAVSYLALFQGLLFPLRPISMKALLRTALRKLPAYFFTQLLYLLAVAFLFSLSYKFFTTPEPTPHPGVRITMGAGTAMAGIWVGIRLALSPIVSLIEETWPLAAFGRSRRLTATLPSADGRRDSPVLRWFALALLPGSIFVMVALITGVAVQWMQPGAAPFAWNTPLLKDVRNLSAFTAAFLALPFYRAGLMALYIEYRMRHEALDFYLRLRERRRTGGEISL